jgi:hypothetical protein
MEGVFKRCFTVALGLRDGVETKFTFCINIPAWPHVILDAYPLHPGPDPGPILEIEGVGEGVLRDLAILDVINGLSAQLGAGHQGVIREAVKRGYAVINEQMPSHVSTSVE